MFKVHDQEFECYIEFTLRILRGKWKTLILWNLKDGTKRFGELRKQIDGCTQRMLVHQLRELERDGIIRREIFPQIPPRVEYSMTECGESLKPILELACDWGVARARELNGSESALM